MPLNDSAEIRELKAMFQTSLKEARQTFLDGLITGKGAESLEDYKLKLGRIQGLEIAYDRFLELIEDEDYDKDEDDFSNI